MEIEKAAGLDDIWCLWKDGVNIGQIRKTQRTEKRFLLNKIVDRYTIIYTMNKYMKPDNVYDLHSFEEAKDQILKHKLQGYFV